MHWCRRSRTQACYTDSCTMHCAPPVSSVRTPHVHTPLSWWQLRARSPSFSVGAETLRQKTCCDTACPLPAPASKPPLEASQYQCSACFSALQDHCSNRHVHLLVSQALAAHIIVQVCTCMMTAPLPIPSAYKHSRITDMHGSSVLQLMQSTSAC